MFLSEGNQSLPIPHTKVFSLLQEKKKNSTGFLGRVDVIVGYPSSTLKAAQELVFHKTMVIVFLLSLISAQNSH